MELLSHTTKTVKILLQHLRIQTALKNSRTKEPANPYALAAGRTMMQTALKTHNVKLRPQEKELIAFELRLFDLHFLIALLPVCSIPTQNVSIQMKTTR